MERQYHQKLIRQMKLYERKHYVCVICKCVVKRSDKLKHTCIPSTTLSIAGS